MCTRTRKRFTDPVMVQLHDAKEHLEASRDQLNRDAGPISLWHIMKAFLKLQRVQRKIDANSD